jgi:hypothetical protein
MSKLVKWEAHKRWIESHPWASSYSGARNRCFCKKNRLYYRYGGRGIKMLMSIDDFKTLWFRDKAYEMDCPSIDRINNDGNYEIENCRFIERSENAARNVRGTKRPEIGKLISKALKGKPKSPEHKLHIMISMNIYRQDFLAGRVK